MGTTRPALSERTRRKSRAVSGDDAVAERDAAGFVVDGEVAEDESLGPSPVPERAGGAGAEFGGRERGVERQGMADRAILDDMIAGEDDPEVLGGLEGPTPPTLPR